MPATALTGGAAPTFSITDQPAGDTVTVTGVSVSEPVWVAVRDFKNGTIGNILGAQKVFAGDTATTITLLRPTLAGATYKAVAYKDVGSSAFNYKEDILIEGVEATFKAK